MSTVTVSGQSATVTHAISSTTNYGWGGEIRLVAVINGACASEFPYEGLDHCAKNVEMVVIGCYGSAA
jgi:hypothetical protein